jgi:hypothetical protein
VSLILDALNRSREDSDPVPGLATRHDAKVAEPAAWRAYLPWAALLVALLIIGMLLFEREEAAPQQQASLAPSPVEKPAAAPPVVAPPAPRAVEKPPAITPAATPTTDPGGPPEKVDAEVAQLYQQPVDDSPVPVDTANREAEPPAAEPLKEVAAAPLPPAQEEQEVDIEKLLLQAEEEVENARLAEHSAPFIADLSQQSKNAIPTVYYQRHDYAGDGSRSKVVLNGQSLGEGGSPASGLKVVEILPDSVVLNFRGTEFRLRALNSWVNL